MSKKYLPLNPQIEIINYWFPFFQYIDSDLKKRIVAWHNIDPTDNTFINELFISRGLKTNLDDIGYIYNYFKFIFVVSKSDFNHKCTQLESMAKELWPLFQCIDKKEKFRRISIQTEDYQNIKITSNLSLKSFEHIFEVALKGNPDWRNSYKYLLNLIENNQSDFLLKRKAGYKFDYTKNVINQSISHFIDYLKENCKSDRAKVSSHYSLIGEILEHIGIIEQYSGDHYKSKYEYYKQKVRSMNMDELIKKRPKLKNELFPIFHFLKLNEHLIR